MLAEEVITDLMKALKPHIKERALIDRGALARANDEQVICCRCKAIVDEDKILFRTDMCGGQVEFQRECPECGNDWGISWIDECRQCDNESCYTQSEAYNAYDNARIHLLARRGRGPVRRVYGVRQDCEGSKMYIAIDGNGVACGVGENEAQARRNATFHGLSEEGAQRVMVRKATEALAEAIEDCDGDVPPNHATLKHGLEGLDYERGIEIGSDALSLLRECAKELESVPGNQALVERCCALLNEAGVER